MGTTPFKLQPQTGYLVAASPDYAGIVQEWLVDYYQPLLSPTALSLLLALSGRLVPNPMPAERHQHTVLLDQLGVGINQIDQARGQLEALGLLRTFFRVDQLGPVVIYQLQALKSPAEFINEDLFAVVLLQHVGERRYQQLVDKANRYHLATDDYHELTQGFFEVFKPLASPADQHTVAASKDQLGQPSEPRVTAPEPSVDWQFLANQVQAQGLASDQLSKHRQLIIAEKRVYGLTELELATLLLAATDLTTGELNAEQFKAVVANRAAPKETVPVKPPPQPADKTETLTPQEKALVLEADQGAPLQYLTDLKKATGSGFVTPTERRTLERLVSQTPLTDGAINVLSYYVVVEQGNANLAPNFVNTIANNWTRQGVRTAADAVAAIQKFWQKTSEPKRPTSKRGRRKTIVEQLPAWAQDDSKQPGQVASPEQIQAAKEALAKLRASENKPHHNQ